jgi:phosphoserine phosphatase
MAFRGLVAFDLDGTLVRIGSSWSWIHKLLGTLEAAKPNADLYYAGKIDYHRWADLDVQLWRGIPLQRVEEAVQKGLEFVSGGQRLIATLRGLRLKTAIVSSGLSVFADKAKEVLGIDVARANRLLTDAKRCIRGVDVRVAYDNKHEVLAALAKTLRIPLSRCVAIGDSRNDIPMFRLAGASIAFNPTDDEVAESATTVVRGENALDLLPAIRRFLALESI